MFNFLFKKLNLSLALSVHYQKNIFQKIFKNVLKYFLVRIDFTTTYIRFWKLPNYIYHHFNFQNQIYVHNTVNR